LSADAVERLLYDADTATSPIPPHNHLFQLLLNRRQFTPLAAGLALKAVEYDLSPLRDALSPPALLLAAMGSAEPAQTASILELTGRPFVVANPNTTFSRQRGFVPRFAQQMLVDSAHIAALRFLAYATAPEDLVPWIRWIGIGGTAPKEQELTTTDGKLALKVLLLGGMRPKKRLACSEKPACLWRTLLVTLSGNPLILIICRQQSSVCAGRS
jgi:hypothetical protein